MLSVNGARGQPGGRPGAPPFRLYHSSGSATIPWRTNQVNNIPSGISSYPMPTQNFPQIEVIDAPYFQAFGFLVLRHFFDPHLIAAEINQVMRNGRRSSFEVAGSWADWRLRTNCVVKTIERVAIRAVFIGFSSAPSLPTLALNPSEIRSCLECHGFAAGASRVAQSFAFQTLRFFPKESRRVSKSGKLCATSLPSFVPTTKLIANVLLAQAGGVRPTS